jgi:hypothetical protein
VTRDWNAIQARLDEYRQLTREPGGDDLHLLETALFLEESLGMTLSDDDIIPQNLGTLEALRGFVALRHGRA